MSVQLFRVWLFLSFQALHKPHSHFTEPVASFTTRRLATIHNRRNQHMWNVARQSNRSGTTRLVWCSGNRASSRRERKVSRGGKLFPYGSRRGTHKSRLARELAPTSWTINPPVLTSQSLLGFLFKNCVSLRHAIRAPFEMIPNTLYFKPDSQVF